MPAPDVNALDAVGVDELFHALELLGQPTVFYHPTRDLPDAQDVPQILGVLTAAVERLAVHHHVYGDKDSTNAWAAGYLQTLGAGTPCGAAQTFDMLTLRIRGTDALLSGYRGRNDMAELVRLCTAAAHAFAVAAAMATDGVRGTGVGSAERLATAQRVTARVAEGNALMSRARDVLGGVLTEVCRRAGIDEDELPGAAGRRA